MSATDTRPSPVQPTTARRAGRMLPLHPIHRLTGADLHGLTPLLRRHRRRPGVSSAPPTFLHPSTGLDLADDATVYAMALHRPFTLTVSGLDLHGASGEYLTFTADNAVTTIPAAAFAARYQCVQAPVTGDELVSWAVSVAAGLLTPLGNRWRHTVTAARHAEQLTHRVPPADRPLLLAAAWLHNIGCAPVLAATGFHPLDGALAVTDGTDGTPARLAGLVAHHTAGETPPGGLTRHLARYPREHDAVAELLAYAVLTASPTGRTVTVAERLDDITDPHGPRHPATCAADGERRRLLDLAARLDPHDPDQTAPAAPRLTAPAPAAAAARTGRGAAQ